MKERLRLRITNECQGLRLPRTLLQRALTEAYGDREEATLNLLVMDDPGITVLNRRHKRRDEPTDVLAFPDGDEDPGSGIVHLGDIAVSGDTAKREAAVRNMKWEHELVFYALHGLFHLLGMDDSDARGRKEMFAAQAAQMTALGLPAPNLE